MSATAACRSTTAAIPNEHLATVFDKAQAMAQLMDRVGYDTFWMAEHHFQHEGYECIPNVLMMAVHLAQVTKRIKIGCGFNIAPMWHPLRLAEDYATADILTRGRTVFGVGRGYHTREVETFGSPLMDQPANRELFEEQVDLIFKAFNNESFSHEGKHYTIPARVPYRGYDLKELTVVPRPLEAAGRMLAADPGRLDAGAGLHGEARHPGPGRRRLGRRRRDAQCRARLAGGAQEARHRPRTRRAARLRLPFLYRRQPRGGHQARRQILRREHEDVRRTAPGARAQRRADRDHARSDARALAKLPRIEDAINAGGVLCGTPPQIIEHLKHIEKRYPGLDRVSVSLSVGVPKALCLEQLERFATEVMPALHQPGRSRDGNGGLGAPYRPRLAVDREPLTRAPIFRNAGEGGPPAPWAMGSG